MASRIEGFKSSDEIKFSTLSDARETDFEDNDGVTNGETSADSDHTMTISTLKNDNGEVVSTPVSEIPELSPT